MRTTRFLAACVGAVLTLCLIQSGFADPKESAPATTDRLRVDPKDFIGDQDTLSGEGWRITKHQDHRESWRARLEVQGKVFADINDCGQFPDWMRFYLWPANNDKKRLLLVWRFAGGAHGPRNLDIVDLADSYRTVLSTRGHVNVDSPIEDLDNDGWPEILGLSTHFDYFNCAVSFCHADSPFPLVIMTYDPTAKNYVCANDRFPDRMREHTGGAEGEFRKAWPREQRIPGSPALANVGSGEYQAFVRLVGWVVDVCYEGRDADAFAILNQYADQGLAASTKQAIERDLMADPNYEEMKRLQKEHASKKQLGSPNN